MEKRMDWKGKRILWGAILFPLMVLGLGYISTKENAYAIDISSSTSKAAKRYLEVSWPASKHRSAVTFQIPEEYLHASTTWRNKDGSIKSFAVQFELPGPMPVQDRPWLKGKKGTPEYEEFMKEWQGRFSMDVEPALVGGAGYRSGMRRNILPSEKLDGEIAGLERYSTLRCFSESEMKKKEVMRFLSEKEKDDMSPVNCRFDRRWVVLVSPEYINGGEEGVGINCSSTGCKAYFSVAGCGVSMGISHRNIENWPAIVEPARALVKSFIQK